MGTRTWESTETVWRMVTATNLEHASHSATRKRLGTQQPSMVEREPDKTDEDNGPDLSPYCRRVLGTRPPSPSHELSAPSRLSGPLKSQAVTALTHRFATWRPLTSILPVIYSSKPTPGARVSAVGRWFSLLTQTSLILNKTLSSSPGRY